jgi:hypothetical protein
LLLSYQEESKSKEIAVLLVALEIKIIQLIELIETMDEQLELFAPDNSQRYAVIFYSCLIKDQFGNTWYRKEIYKSNLSENDAKDLTASLNQSLNSDASFYEAIPEEGPNFLIP